MWKRSENAAGFIPGVPARDIPDAEAEERGLVAELEGSMDYKHVDDQPEPRGRRAREGNGN
ncbi:MAG: hypothetical protein IIB78_10890 [Proteobacteria bacterium]|nr:hypothetical protein [Pseudomonadota bacterium]